MKAWFITFILFLNLVHAEPVSYKWVEHDGRMIKQWTITNEKYVPKKRTPASITNQIVKKIAPIANQKKLQTSLELELGYGITSLSTLDPSNNAKGEINSKSVLNGEFTWLNAFNISNFFLTGGVEKISFDAGVFEIQNTEQTLIGSKIGLIFGERYKWRASLNYGQHMFLTVKDQKYSLENLNLPSAELSLKHDFYELNSWTFSYEAGVEYIVSGSSDVLEVESGQRSFAAIGAIKKRKNLDINLSLGLDYQQQSTLAVEQNLLNFSTKLGTIIHF